MKVLLSVDVELWCNSWQTLDDDFPTAFDRYTFGRSEHGDYALPKTLELLNRYGLNAVFFVEPLFAARFGVEYLAVMVDLIRGAGQEVQLHLHPEWTDEALKPLLPDIPGKRQHLFQYTLAEQSTLIAHGLRLMREVGVTNITAFRAGSFACNRATYTALAANGISIDSSINPTLRISGADVAARSGYAPYEIDGVTVYPMSAFVDGFGRARHAQVGACSFGEMRQAILAAHGGGWDCFVALSHNFELLKPGSNRPDGIVARRFRNLCRFLGEAKAELPTARIEDLPRNRSEGELRLPRVGALATATRFAEQLLCRLP